MQGFILKACLKTGKAHKANDIYSQCLCIAGEDNLHGREMIAFYRHHKLLWSKPLPCGIQFELVDSTPQVYLHHHSVIGES